MLVQKYIDMLGAKSVIRDLAGKAAARGAEIGYENVFDYKCRTYRRGFHQV